MNIIIRIILISLATGLMIRLMKNFRMKNSGSQLYIQNSKPLKTLLLLINYSRNWNAKAAFNDMPTESGNCGKTEDPPFSWRMHNIHFYLPIHPCRVPGSSCFVCLLPFLWFRFFTEKRQPIWNYYKNPAFSAGENFFILSFWHYCFILFLFVCWVQFCGWYGAAAIIGLTGTLPPTAWKFSEKPGLPAPSVPFFSLEPFCSASS